MTKKRADVYLVESGVVESRELAKQLIEEGKVLAGGRLVEKPSTLIDSGVHIEVESRPSYVSRGGLKLEKAIHLFEIDVADMLAIDIGVGSGGFTDCLLQHGARRVIAVDVGYGQVAWKIRTDPRVHLLERTNFRELDIASIEHPVDIAVVDLSFISVTKVFDKIAELLRPGGLLAILVKPQFEAGREFVGKKGIIRDRAVHKMVLGNMTDFFAEKGATVKGITYSPIKGGKGNIEFLLYAALEPLETPVDWSDKIDQVVGEAHSELNDER